MDDGTGKAVEPRDLRIGGKVEEADGADNKISGEHLAIRCCYVPGRGGVIEACGNYARVQPQMVA